MANAVGGLAGTLFLDPLYQSGMQYGVNGDLVLCIWAAVAYPLAASGLALLLPAHAAPRTRPIKLKNRGE